MWVLSVMRVQGSGKLVHGKGLLVLHCHPDLLNQPSNPPLPPHPPPCPLNMTGNSLIFLLYFNFSELRIALPTSHPTRICQWHPGLTVTPPKAVPRNRVKPYQTGCARLSWETIISHFPVSVTAVPWVWILNYIKKEVSWALGNIHVVTFLCSSPWIWHHWLLRFLLPWLPCCDR